MTEPSGDTHPPTRDGRVLIIEDEEMLRRAHHRMLHRHFDLEFAASAEAAIDVLSRDTAFDVILCDMSLPGGRDGTDVYRALHEIAPGLCPKVIFCHGGYHSERQAKFVESLPNKAIVKPISPSELRQTLAATRDRFRS